LPASEIRSARPKRTVVANINNQGVAFEKIDGFKTISFELKEIAEYVWIPSAGFPEEEIYKGFGFDQFNKDLFGVSRTDNNAIGALTGQPTTAPAILDRSQYGTNWYKTDKAQRETTTHPVKEGQNIAEIIAQAKEGDIIEFAKGDYSISSSLKIDKILTIQAASSDSKINLKYSGPVKTPLFEMNPNAQLTLKGIQLKGNDSQYAFASLQENMSNLYNLSLENCVVENFDYILKAYKYSFSEHINFTKSTFRNCGAEEKNGILLNTYGIINVDISDNVFKNNNVERVAQLWGAKNNNHSNNVITNSGKIVVEENLKLKTFY